MRYAAGLFYALAIIGGRRATFDIAMVGALIFCGTVALCFAVEGIVLAALRAPRTTDLTRLNQASAAMQGRAPNHEDPPHG